MAKLNLVSCLWLKVKVDGSTIPCGRTGHSVIINNDELLMFGGSRYEKFQGGFVSRYLNDMYRFSVSEGRISWCQVTQHGEIPSPRDSQSFSAVCNKVYLFGGKSYPTVGESMEGMFEFDPETSTWTRLCSSGNQPRTVGHSVSSFDKTIFIFGGLHQGKATNNLTTYDTERNHWEQIEALGTYPTSRCDHTSEIVNGVLYIFGGLTKVNEWLNDLHTFHIGSCTWSQPQIRGLPPTPRCLHSFIAHRDKDIYLFGGWVKEKGQHTVLRGLRKLSVGNKKWKNVFCAGDDPPNPRYGHCAVICHSKMYVIGGMEINGEAEMDTIPVLQTINPSDRKLVVAHALKDLEHS